MLKRVRNFINPKAPQKNDSPESNSGNFSELAIVLADFSYLLEDIEQVALDFNYIVETAVHITEVAADKYQQVYELAQSHNIELAIDVSKSRLHAIVQARNIELLSLREQAQNLENALKDCQRNYETNMEEYYKDLAYIDMLKKEKVNLESKLIGLGKENQALKQRAKELEEENTKPLEDWEQEKSILTSELDQIDKENQALKQGAKELEEANQVLSEQEINFEEPEVRETEIRKRYRSQLKDQNKQIKLLTKQLTKLERELNIKTIELEQQKERESQFYFERQEFQNLSGNLEKQIEEMTREKRNLQDKLQSHEQQSRYLYALEQEKQQLNQKLFELNEQHNEMLQLLNEYRRDKPGTSKSSDTVHISEVTQKLKYYRDQPFQSTSRHIVNNYLERHPEDKNQRKRISAKIRSVLAKLLFDTPVLSNFESISQKLEDALDIQLEIDTKQQIDQLILEAQQLLDASRDTDPPGKLFFGTTDTKYDSILQQAIAGSDEDGFVVYITFPGFKVGDRILIKADVFISNKTTRD